MKKAILLALIILVLNIPGRAQNYQSLFGDTATSWVFRVGNLGGLTKDSLYVEKDTIINGTTYMKISTGLPAFYAGGLLREDLDSGKVFYRELYSAKLNNYLDTAERVLLRYDLNVGDVFDGRAVDSINTIEGFKYIY